MALQKDHEISQLKLVLQEKEHELSQMQKALDKLQHRPVPKPRMRALAADPQVVKNLQDQLSSTERQLEDTVEELTKAKNTHEMDAIHIGELRARLTEATASNRKDNEEIDRLNTEVHEFKAKNVTLSTELDAAKLKIHELEINNRELRRVSQVNTLPPRVTAAFNSISVKYELQRAKFPVTKWRQLCTELKLFRFVITIDTQFRDDASKLHGLIRSWVDNTKDSNPWSTLVKAVDRIGEHGVATELATAVGVQHPGNVRVMLH